MYIVLLLLLLTPNKILKKTENRVLLSVSEWGPSTVGRTRKKKICDHVTAFSCVASLAMLGGKENSSSSGADMSFSEC